ncbi:hypothetical protein JVT61DRAFT_11755 [Boletus reticuloceps]|uniref:HNH nuclease domain-containing protein n=1 Tax=Boletus reticuloceps TaxID=495285 RepID=A0A8I2YVF9_9AGAM|nr:hypothetical protein JVT61DRAFT_11755 [Boletus reticuloceps]
MEQHALGILQNEDLLGWDETRRIQASGKQGGTFRAITPKLLYYLTKESQGLGGKVLNQFWKQLGACHKKLKKNIKSLKQEDFVSAQTSFDVLFRGLDPKDVDFEPVLKMAAEFFTHIGVAFMNPGGSKSGTSTEFSVSEVVNEEIDKLLHQVNEEGDFGKRKQELLKALSFRRDGDFCLLTGVEFMHSKKKPGVYSALAHIIPNSVHGKPDTLKCIAMFAGPAARDEVMHHLNNIGNVMNMQHDAHVSYDNLDWGIEAKEEGGEVKYFFRTVPTNPGIHGLFFINLRDGEEIQFGKGPEGKKLGNGPTPRLCNLQLAVARVLKLSGAADIILEWKDLADDDGYYRPFIASEEFCDMLDAKLFLSGRAVVV